jgi:uncharacterized membrane protein
MTWHEVTFYFVGCSLILIIASDFYGRALLKISTLSKVTRFTLALLLYLCFGIIIGIIASGMLLEKPPSFHDESDLFFYGWLFGFALSSIPAIFYFERKYIPDLKRAGFFTD